MIIHTKTTLSPDLVKALESLTKAGLGKALTAGINRTAMRGRTVVSRVIRAEYFLKANQVNPRVGVRMSNRDTLTAVIHPFEGGYGRSMNMIRFVSGNPRPRKAQLKFKIKRSRGTVNVDGAFVGNKGRTVFVRDPERVMPSRSSSKGVKHRQAIKALTTLGVPTMFNSRRVKEASVREIERILPVEIQRAIMAAAGGFIKARG